MVLLFLYCLVYLYLALSIVDELPDPSGYKFLTPSGKGLFDRISPTNLSSMYSRTERISASDLGDSVSSLSGRDSYGE